MRAVLLLLLSAAMPATAALTPFSEGRFRLFQSRNRTIVLQFTGAGCSVCPQQEAVLQELSEEPGDTTPVFFQVPFVPGDDKNVEYGVTAPSTLVVLKGKRMIGSSVSLYTEEEVRSFIADVRMRARAVPPPRPKRVLAPKR